MSTEDDIQKERDEWCEGLPKVYQSIYIKAMRGKSLRAAVIAKCQDCASWQREEVKNCLVVTCPLYPYRPYQKLRNPSPEGSLATNAGRRVSEHRRV